MLSSKESSIDKFLSDLKRIDYISFLLCSYYFLNLEIAWYVNEKYL